MEHCHAGGGWSEDVVRMVGAIQLTNLEKSVKPQMDRGEHLTSK
jgi:hypothetical protein